MHDEPPPKAGAFLFRKPAATFLRTRMHTKSLQQETTMAFIDKLKEELDRAGRAAQNALDEGKVRLEAFRTRQLADKAAQALGYAVFRARQAGGEIDPESYARLSASLATHEAEATRLEQELRDAGPEKPASEGAEPPPPPSPPPASAAPPPPPEAPAM